jgi:hypothetical protein
VQWQRLALSAAGGFASAAPGGLHPIAADDLRDTVVAFTGGTIPEWALSDTHVGVAARGVTAHDLPLAAILDVADPNAERWTMFAVIPDDDTSVAGEAHRERWRDWLQWANLLQFLGSIDSERTAWIGAASQRGGPAVDDLYVLSLARGAAVRFETLARSEISDEMQESLELIIDSEVRAFVTDALLAGAPEVEAGPEYDGVPVEAAWPASRVGVMPVGDERTVDDWDIRPVDRWTVPELLTRLRGN